MERKKRETKYTFILKNIDTQQVDKKYGISLVSNIDTTDINELSNITQLSDLVTENKFFSYLDEAKKEHRCMVVLTNNGKNLPTRTSVNCFWCRYPFDTLPLGCPIKFCPTQLTKKYYSEITKDIYSIRENVSAKKSKHVEANFVENEEISINKKEHYETDGIFCSFNCCLAFIEAHYFNPLYTNSKTLLYRIFNKLFHTTNNIVPAPSWKLLKNRGSEDGIDIKDFRDNFYKINYDDAGIVKNFPCCKEIGYVFEKKTKF